MASEPMAEAAPVAMEEGETACAMEGEISAPMGNFQAQALHEQQLLHEQLVQWLEKYASSAAEAMRNVMAKRLEERFQQFSTVQESARSADAAKAWSHDTERVYERTSRYLLSVLRPSELGGSAGGGGADGGSAVAAAEPNTAITPTAGHAAENGAAVPALLPAEVSALLASTEEEKAGVEVHQDMQPSPLQALPSADQLTGLAMPNEAIDEDAVGIAALQPPRAGEQLSTARSPFSRPLLNVAAQADEPEAASAPAPTPLASPPPAQPRALAPSPASAPVPAPATPLEPNQSSARPSLLGRDARTPLTSDGLGGEARRRAPPTVAPVPKRTRRSSLS